jgi:hypothetical protein
LRTHLNGQHTINEWPNGSLCQSREYVYKYIVKMVFMCAFS